MRKLFACCFSIAAILLIARAEALGCGCVDLGDSLESKVANWSKSSSAVFSGKVLKSEEVEETIDIIYTFAVDEVWKGELGQTTEIRVTRSSCGIAFESGMTYLVYAFKSSGFLKSGACTGVAERDEAYGKQQLKILGKGKSPRTEQRKEPTRN